MGEGHRTDVIARPAASCFAYRQNRRGSLQRRKILGALASNNDCVLEVQSAGRMFEIIERIEESVKIIEKQLTELTKKMKWRMAS